MRALPGLLALIIGLGSASSAHAIYGGARAPKGAWGAAVYFQWRAAGGQGGGCSGVLITARAVLTAAHCVRTPGGRQRRVRSVRVGNPRDQTTQARVASVHVHPSYDPAKPHAGGDLALLLLGRPVEGHSPIPIARAGDDPKRQGTRLFIAGFGISRDRRGRIVRTPRLRQIEQELLSPFHCFTGPVKEMSRTRICAAAPGRAVCPGDSGSPATVRRPGAPELVFGIVSVAIDLKVCSKTATQLTRVSAYADWVHRITRPPPD